MTPQSMSFIFGAILLAVAILGGGFEVKEIKVSNVSVGVRIVAGIVGLFFIVLGFWQQPIALTESGSAPGGSGMGPPLVVPRPPPKPDEALVVGNIPFISDRDRIDVDALYVPAQDHKALAISFGQVGLVSGRPSQDEADRAAVELCKKTESSGQGETQECSLFASGNLIVASRSRPPMPGGSKSNSLRPDSAVPANFRHPQNL